MQSSHYDIITFLLITTLLILVMGGFIVTILFFYRKRQITYLNDLERMKSDYEKTLLKTQLEIQEQTFQTISRDIHDNINLSLTLAKLNLNTINLNNKKKSSEQVESTVNFVSKAITDLSDISRSMNSDIIIERGLISALEYETNKLRDLNWFLIEFVISGNPVYLESQKELFIFRIVQEAFNNILKHAHSNNVQLHLYYYIDHLEISIKDDGIGFNNLNGMKKSIPTAGLKNMQKRAELLNGKFELNTVPGKGTSIKITLPFNT